MPNYYILMPSGLEVKHKPSKPLEMSSASLLAQSSNLGTLRKTLELFQVFLSVQGKQQPSLGTVGETHGLFRYHSGLWQFCCIAHY